MTGRGIERIIPLAILLFLAVWWWWQDLARKRFVARIKTMAERGRDEIDGQSVNHYLDILNRDTAQALIAIDTIVVMYKGQQLFFVNGTIGYMTACKNPWRVSKLCFAVAVGQAVVRLLSEQELILRRITGSSELAAFSVRRWSDFVFMLMTEKTYLIDE